MSNKDETGHVSFEDKLLSLTVFLHLIYYTIFCIEFLWSIVNWLKKCSNTDKQKRLSENYIFVLNRKRYRISWFA